MANQFKLPDLGEGLHEAEINEILVKKGDSIKEGDPLIVVETDKASVEIPSPYTGSIQEIHVNEGDIVEVGTILITFGDGSQLYEPTEQKRISPHEKVVSEPRLETAAIAAVHTAASVQVAASPATRRLARELGVEIKMVAGSGPGGRITEEDVRRYAQTGTANQALPEPSTRPLQEPVSSIQKTGQKTSSLITDEDLALPDFSAWGEIQKIELRSIRRAVAKRMTLAWTQIPHVSHHEDADITELEKLRQNLKNEVEGGVTLTVILIKAVVAALKKYPNFNSSLDSENGIIIQKHFYNIGIAVDTNRGLIVPVIRDADRKSMAELAIELNALVKRTREDKNTLEDLQRGTFTITNAGVLGGTHLTPIINYPQAAILGAARAEWKPVVRKAENDIMQIVPRYILPVSITFDHRILDGGDGARFLGEIVQILEKPEKLLLNI